MNYLLPMQDIMSMHCSANVVLKVMLRYSLVYLEQEKQLYLLLQIEN